MVASLQIELGEDCEKGLYQDFLLLSTIYPARYPPVKGLCPELFRDFVGVRRHLNIYRRFEGEKKTF